jgi:hypothetical protein
VFAYDEIFTTLILNASHVSETKQYRTANLDFKVYEQAILTHFIVIIIIIIIMFFIKTSFLVIWAVFVPSYMQDYCIKTSSLLRDVARCRVVIRYRRCGSIYQFHLQGSSTMDCLTVEIRVSRNDGIQLPIKHTEAEA